MNKEVKSSAIANRWEMNKLAKIHQFHTSVLFGDALSNQMIDISETLRNVGYDSRIFCEVLPPNDFAQPTYLIEEYAKESSPDTILIVHFSLEYSNKVMTWLESLPDKIVLIYHNITPHHYFYGVNEYSYNAARRGRKQLRLLSTFIDFAVGDSLFNCSELRKGDWRSIQRLPISFDIEKYSESPSPSVLEWGAEQINILFVGRLAPNKKFEDLLLTFYYLKHYVMPDARLVLVGASHGMQPYVDYLHALVEKLALQDVYFVGHVSTAELVAYYQTASVYLSMSEHEGFGVPLLESAYFDVPVVAYKSTAVPETLDGRGVLFTKKRYDAVAELIGTVINDQELHQRIVKNQRLLLKNHSYKSFQKELLTIVDSVANGASTNVYSTTHE